MSYRMKKQANTAQAGPTAGKSIQHRLVLTRAQAEGWLECLRFSDTHNTHDYGLLPDLIGSAEAAVGKRGKTIRCRMNSAELGVSSECVDFAIFTGLPVEGLDDLRSIFRDALTTGLRGGDLTCKLWVQRSIHRENDDRLRLEANYIYAPDDRLESWKELGAYETEREFGNPEDEPVFTGLEGFDALPRDNED